MLFGPSLRHRVLRFFGLIQVGDPVVTFSAVKRKVVGEAAEKDGAHSGRACYDGDLQYRPLFCRLLLDNSLRVFDQICVLQRRVQSRVVLWDDCERL